MPILIRHPAGKAKGQRRGRYFASTHDVGPTVLSVLGEEAARKDERVDLSPLFDGRRPAGSGPTGPPPTTTT